MSRVSKYIKKKTPDVYAWWNDPSKCFVHWGKTKRPPNEKRKIITFICFRISNIWWILGVWLEHFIKHKPCMCTTFLKFNFSIQFYFSKAIYKLWLSVKIQLHVPLHHNLDLGINHRIGNPKQNSIEANVSIEVKTKHSFCCLFSKMRSTFGSVEQPWGELHTCIWESYKA